jgi:acyl-CoA reductase-like NAD-dependent aldehyde dehydrogenase
MNKIEIPQIFSNAISVENGILKLKLLINGVWKDAKDYFDLHSPLDGELIAKIPSASKEDIDEAIEAGKRAEELMANIPAIERYEITQKFMQLLAQYEDFFVKVLMIEAGKDKGSAEGEINTTLNRLYISAQDFRALIGEYIPGDLSRDKIKQFAIVRREPIGLVVGIAPFNYPFYTAFAKVIPAILAGDPIIVKPPSADPIAFMLATELLRPLLPAGAIQVLTMPGGPLGDYLVSHTAVKMISFTGSTSVGRHISSIGGLKRMHMELGGKGTAIVLEDADLELAAKEIVKGSLTLAGQRCDAISRVLVVESVKDKLIELIKKELEHYKLGNPLVDANANVGPVISESAAQRINSMVKDAIEKGAKLLAGGNYNKAYHDITLLADVPLSAVIANEETFGPVITVITVKDMEEAISVANASNYGLDSAVFTNNFNKAYEIMRRLHTGNVSLNMAPSHGSAIFPFGGINDSGIGKEGVASSIREMTYEKTMIFNLNNTKVLS